MKPLLTLMLLLGCSGPEFTSAERNSPSTLSGQSGETQSSGGLLGEGGQDSGAGMGAGSASIGTLAGGAPEAGGGGITALAGGPAMGEGGEGGLGAESSETECLIPYFQGHTCGVACHQSESDCSQVLYCWYNQNSFDNCSEFTSLGISTALEVKRNCCHD